jgi:hypothetical protein
MRNHGYPRKLPTTGYPARHAAAIKNSLCRPLSAGNSPASDLVPPRPPIGGARVSHSLGNRLTPSVYSCASRWPRRAARRDGASTLRDAAPALLAALPEPLGESE